MIQMLFSRDDMLYPHILHQARDFTIHEYIIVGLRGEEGTSGRQ